MRTELTARLANRIDLRMCGRVMVGKHRVRRDRNHLPIVYDSGTKRTAVAVAHGLFCLGGSLEHDLLLIHI